MRAARRAECPAPLHSEGFPVLAGALARRSPRADPRPTAGKPARETLANAVSVITATCGRSHAPVCRRGISWQVGGERLYFPPNPCAAPLRCRTAGRSAPRTQSPDAHDVPPRVAPRTRTPHARSDGFHPPTGPPAQSIRPARPAVPRYARGGAAGQIHPERLHRAARRANDVRRSSARAAYRRRQRQRDEAAREPAQSRRRDQPDEPGEGIHRQHVRLPRHGPPRRPRL